MFAFFDKKKKIEKWGEKKNVDKLVKELSNNKSDIRISVIQALGHTKDYRAVSALISSLTDPDLEVKALVIDTLGEIADPRAKEHLRHIAENEENKEIKDKAAQALAKIAGKGL